MPKIELILKSQWQEMGHLWRWKTNQVLMFDTGNSFGFIPVRAKDDLGKIFMTAAANLNDLLGGKEPWRFGK